MGPGQTHDRKRFPIGCDVEVVEYSWSDRGGPKDAVLRLTGQQAALWSASDLLTEPVFIYSPNGTLVWWGRIYSISIGIGDISIGASLDEMANRVAVTYSIYSAVSGYTAVTTGFLDHADSQAEFGQKELIYSMGDASDSQAQAKRAQILADLAWPLGRTLFSSEQGAVLTCKGNMEFLDWKVYNDPQGVVENISSGGGTLAVGWALNSTKVIFYQKYIYTMDRHLAALEAGDSIAVTGTNLNNRVHVLSASPSSTSQIASRTASTIYFDPSDDIHDSANGLDIFSDGTIIEISGSSLNNGVHHLRDKVDASHMRITPALSRNISAEGAGFNVTISEGQRVAVASATSDEGAGDSVVMQVVGVMTAQSFVPAVNMSVGRVAISIATVGTPTDNLVLGIYTDSSGMPNALVGSALSVAASTLPVDSPTEVWFSFINPVPVIANTTYWLRISRSGANSATQYFLLGLSDTPYRNTKGWSGSSWLTLSRDGVNISVPFRLEDSEDTTDTMARIVASAGQSFVTSFSEDTNTGVTNSRFRDSGNSALQEILKLLDSGNSVGTRLTALVTPGGELQVTSQPVSSMENAFLSSDNVLVDAGGAPWDEGRLPVGEWVSIREIPDSINSFWRLSPFYVEAASYDVGRRKMRLTPRGSRKFMDLLRRG